MGGDWLAQLGEHATLNLRAVGSSPTPGREPTHKKGEKEKEERRLSPGASTQCGQGWHPKTKEEPRGDFLPHPKPAQQHRKVQAAPHTPETVPVIKCPNKSSTAGRLGIPPPKCRHCWQGGAWPAPCPGRGRDPRRGLLLEPRHRPSGGGRAAGPTEGTWDAAECGLTREAAKEGSGLRRSPGSPRAAGRRAGLFRETRLASSKRAPGWRARGSAGPRRSPGISARAGNSAGGGGLQ